MSAFVQFIKSVFFATSLTLIRELWGRMRCWTVIKMSACLPLVERHDVERTQSHRHDL